MSSISAISSITDSVAKATIGAPGARYALVEGLLVTMSYPSMRTFSMLYGAKMAAHAGATGPPPYAPPSNRNLPNAAVIRPSLVTPILTVT